MNLQIAISGAHRTGKSSLCKTLSQSLGLPFLESSTTKILQKYGYEADANLRFPERMKAQLLLAQEYDKNFFDNKKFITDRCHFDFMLYSFMEVGNDFPYDKNLENEFESYIDSCVKKSKNLDALYLLQPGIPIFYTKGKASAVTPLLEKLNLLALGLISQYNIPCTIIPKDCLDMKQRVEFISADLNQKFGILPSIES